MLGEDGRIVLLAATGNIRTFISQRLNEDNANSPRANLAPITERIIVYPTGSAFESDWIVLERARDGDTELYQKLKDQNRRAVLVLMKDSGTWRVEDTTSVLPILQNDVVLGPALTTKAATLMGDVLNDVFELCRFPKELAAAPLGKACAYKEMGRCPAACDGSESMESYRIRFKQAVDASALGLKGWKKSCEQQIADASKEMDFELAQNLKRNLDQIQRLTNETLGYIGRMDSFRCVIVTPGVRKGWAMLWVFGSDGIVPILSTSCGSNLERLRDAINSFGDAINMDQLGLDRFSLIARHWMTKPTKAKRRRVSIQALNDSNSLCGLENAIQEACSPIDLIDDDEEHTHIKG